MSNQRTESFVSSFKSDILSSFVVFLIALPLSLGIALASGAPMNSALIAASVGGIVVGLLSGSPLQVAGPAAGLSIIVLGFIQKFGFETTCAITVVAGVIQIILGLLGSAQLAFIIAPAVVHAMLGGIGVLIILTQSHVLMGTSPKGGTLKNLMGLPDSITHMNHSAALLGALTLIVLICWNRWGSKKFPSLPGSLIAVIFGTVVSLFMHESLPHVQLTSHILDGLHFPHFNQIPISDFITASVILALIASAESLLCAVAIDKLHSGPRADLSRKLFAQGVGNTVSGFLGGLPVIGEIVRSSANISSGAQTRFSSIMHGAWVLLFATFFSDLLNKIPLSVLAALLIYTGSRLIKLSEIKHLAEFRQLAIYGATLFGVVFIDLLWGLGIGFSVATISMIYQITQFEFYSYEQGDEINVWIYGNLTFLSVPSLLKNLNSLPLKKNINLNFDVDHLDHASIEAISSWREGYEKTGGKVYKTSLRSLWNDLKVPTQPPHLAFQSEKNKIQTDNQEASG